jgi:hypothetical protein
MCEETGLFKELVSVASHPRVAGIVQTHRQHIDAQNGQHGVMTKDIELPGKYQAITAAVKQARRTLQNLVI